MDKMSTHLTQQIQFIAHEEQYSTCANNYSMYRLLWLWEALCKVRKNCFHFLSFFKKKFGVYFETFPML